MGPHRVIVSLAFLFFFLLSGKVELRSQQILHGLRFGLNSSQLWQEGDTYYADRLERYYFSYIRESDFLALARFGAGFEFYQNGGTNDVGDQVKISYLAIPLSIKVNIGPAFVRGGYIGALRVDVTEKQNGRLVSVPKGKYNRWDSGVFLGAGARFLIFFLDVRHVWGQVDVIDGYTTRQWQIGGGILFRVRTERAY